MFAGILLYTRIYTTVIARSAATWQSSFVTSPRSRDAKHTPQPQFPFDFLDPHRTHRTHQPQCPQHHFSLLSPFCPLCPPCVSRVAPRSTKVIRRFEEKIFGLSIFLFAQNLWLAVMKNGNIHYTLTAGEVSHRLTTKSPLSKGGLEGLYI